MKNLRILIVDDLPVNLKLLRVQLTAEGHTVLEAANGAEALKSLETAAVDLIISDILMPVMDGYRLCAEIRRNPRYEQLPFIFYTATYTSPADEELCLQLGADKYLRKPVAVPHLLAAIEEALATSGRKAVMTVEEQDILKEYSERLVFKLEQKNSELSVTTERLGEALDQLRQILDHSPALLYSLRVEGETITPRVASDNITRLFGYDAAETLDMDWWMARIHPDDRVRYRESIAETLAEGTSRTEYRVRHRDGAYRWVDDTRRLVRDATGDAVEIFGVTSDITDRKRAQDELRESERRFREMLNNLELVSMMLDTTGRITYCNDSFLRLTGWERKEVLGSSWFDRFIHADSVDSVRTSFQALLANRPEVWHFTNEIQTRSGERRLIQWNNSLLRSPAGEVIGTASIGEDITDRRRLEQQVLRTQRLESLGTLASGIAHDLNNLLMPILMGASLLKRLEPNAASLKAIDNIERSVKRGSDLVKQVLLFARGGETSWRTISLGEIVREVEAIVVSTFPKDITLEVSLAHDLKPVAGDPTQLNQVLLNLCVNARDAMPHGGLLSVSARNEHLTEQYARLQGGESGGLYVVLEVSDTGEGISSQTIDRIFDPFFTTKDIGKGTGLGLSTAQGIVTRHGGYLSVSSDVGEGSTFKVHLPPHVVESGASPIVEDAELRRGNGEWILVVDDDASVVNVTRQTLESFGYRVLGAEDGAQAIGVYSRRHADIALVITDMMMPVIDGAALIAALRRIHPEVRIIATTGNLSAAYMTKIAKTEVLYVLTKPYTADHLLRTVSDALA